MKLLFALVDLDKWSWEGLAIFVVAVAAIIAVVGVVLNKLKIRIPDWLIYILMIVVVAFVAIKAIRLIAAM